MDGHGREAVIDRRCFLKRGATAGTWALTAPLLRGLGWPETAPAASSGQTAPPGTRIVRTGCPSHNCGGRCLLKLHVRDGVIVRIESDDRPADTLDDPQLRACARGRAYRRRQYHPDRVLHPLKRIGRRGEGRFERVTWDEALDRMAAELTRVKATYGNAALFVPYGTGSYSQTNGRQTAQRLMNLFGGSLGH
jgi:anaerobic dimethyl sulfoxide reductase subunit A